MVTRKVVVAPPCGVSINSLWSQMKADTRVNTNKTFGGGVTWYFHRKWSKNAKTSLNVKFLDKITTIDKLFYWKKYSVTKFYENSFWNIFINFFENLVSNSALSLVVEFCSLATPSSLPHPSNTMILLSFQKFNENVPEWIFIKFFYQLVSKKLDFVTEYFFQ